MTRKNPQRIGEAWNKFSRVILDPINAPQLQRQEMRRAFYAGASTIFTIMTNQVSEGDEVQEADMNLMDDLHQELNRFSDAVGAGRA